MNTRRYAILTSSALTLTLALLWLLFRQPDVAYAGDVTVCLPGTGTCGYATIQDAVDAAGTGDVIKVATGVYTGVNNYGGLAQMVYIDKSVTIRGGYTTTNWSASNPISYPTTLDAQGQGRVLYISGDISPTVEGLRLTGGDATGLGGDPWGDAGGGVYVITATAIISNNQVLSNTAEVGGGLYLGYSAATLTDNDIISNTADSSGGGLYLAYSDNATLISNTVSTNTAEWGGGLYLWYNDNTMLSGNTVSGNTSSQSGGGLVLVVSAATLSGNTVTSNTAEHGGGGGLYMQDSTVTLSGNTITSNTVQGGIGGGLCVVGGNFTFSGNTVTSNTARWHGGGGLFLDSDATLSGNTFTANTARWSKGGGLFLVSNATLINNVVADNQADANGSGLYIQASSPHLLHTTIARNGGGDGSGIYVGTDYYGTRSSVALTNTILVSQAVGVYVESGNTVTLEATLWGTDTWANDADWGGAGAVITGTPEYNYWGAPAFLDPDAGDYHIGATSAARDKGIDAGVTDDIDGHVRPSGGGFDIGADEFSYAVQLTPDRQGTADPDSVITYTHTLTNAGSGPDTFIITHHSSQGWPVQYDTLVSVGYGQMAAVVVSVTVPAGVIGGVVDVTVITATSQADSRVWASVTDTTTVVLSPLDVPVLLFPPSGTVTTTQAITFTWIAGAGASPTGYNVMLDGELFTTTATISPTVLSIGVHAWAVRAFNADGTSDWADVWRVEVTGTLSPPGIPTLLFPPDGHITTTQAVTLAWTAGAGAAPDGYHLRLDEGDVITTTATTSPTVLSIGVHTWTVRAFNAARYSDWADAWRVEVTGTLSPPGIPTLIFPPDGHITTTQAITLAWTAGAGAAPDGYHLRLDEGDVFTTTATTSPIVLSIGVYTWTVRAYNADGTSDWADAWTIEVIPHRIYLPLALKNH